MGKTVRIERHRRGFFGWIFRVLFLVFNVFMLLVILRTLYAAWSISESALGDDTTGARTGAAAAVILGILAIWVVGGLFLGVLSYVTRGNKVITETIEN